MTDYEEDIIADILEKVSRLAEIIRDHTDQLNLTEKEKDDLIDIENITSYLTCKGWTKWKYHLYAKSNPQLLYL